MKVFVVTGGVGCGKATFCRLVSERVEGTEIFDADRCVHGLLTSPAVVRRVGSEFGSGVVDAHGTVDRTRLGEVVFSSAQKRRQLEQILHPFVLTALVEAISRAREAGLVNVFIADVPLYFESDGFDVPNDGVIAVGASRAVQVARVVERADGRFDRDAAERVIDAQMPVAEKLERADVAVWNDGNEAVLAAQVERFLAGVAR